MVLGESEYAHHEKDRELYLHMKAAVKDGGAW